MLRHLNTSVHHTNRPDDARELLDRRFKAKVLKKPFLHCAIGDVDIVVAQVGYHILLALVELLHNSEQKLPNLTHHFRGSVAGEHLLAVLRVSEDVLDRLMDDMPVQSSGVLLVLLNVHEHVTHVLEQLAVHQSTAGELRQHRVLEDGVSHSEEIVIFHFSIEEEFRVLRHTRAKHGQLPRIMKLEDQPYPGS